MVDQENVVPNDEPWWLHLAQEACHDLMPVVDEKIESFARKCYRQFFIRQKIDKETYLQCCGVSWMIQCLETGQWTATQLLKAAQSALSIAGDESCMAGWVLPKVEVTSSSSKSSFDLDPEECHVYLWIQLWRKFYKACDDREQSFQSTLRPAKRQRKTYHYYNKKSATDELWKGAYKVPTVVLLASILLHGSDNMSWKDLDGRVHHFTKIFKTLTVGDIEAGLVVLGMQCLSQGRRVPGLTPCLVLDGYLNRTGGTTLSVLKEALHFDQYYPLRASICEHLLEPVYSSESGLSDDESQATIRACSMFLNREDPATFIGNLSNALQEEKEEGSDKNSTLVPANILSPRYPLLTHLDVWLMQEDMWRATGLVRLMEQQNNLDGLWKDEAYLHLWQHLLRRGQIFLDGNDINTLVYSQKRDLLYNGIVNGMGAYGRGSMIDFYQTLAQTVWDHPQPNTEEKHYVLVACQQTLLRLLFKSCGLGTTTTMLFLKQASWPIPVQETSGGVSLASSNTSTDLDKWATDFLTQRNPIPDSLLVQEGTGAVLDLSRFVEKQEEDGKAKIVQLSEVEEKPMVDHVQRGDEPQASIAEEAVVDSSPDSTKQANLAAKFQQSEGFDVDYEQRGEVEEPQGEVGDDVYEENMYREEDHLEAEKGGNYNDDEQEDEEQDQVIDIEDDDEDVGEGQLEKAKSCPAARVGQKNYESSDEDDNHGPDMGQDVAGNADSSDGTAEMSEDEVYQYEDSPVDSRSRPRRDEDDVHIYNYSDAEESAVERGPRPRIDYGRRHSDEDEEQGHGHSSQDDDGRDDEDSSSDGGDQGEDQEAVVIQDSEDEAPAAPQRLFERDLRDDDSDFRGSHDEQFEDAENGSGEEDDEMEMEDRSPHRIAMRHDEDRRFPVDYQGQDADDEIQGGEELDAARRVRHQELNEDGARGIQVQQELADHEPVEIIDDDEETSGQSYADAARPKGHSDSFERGTAMHVKRDRATSEQKAAESIASMFDTAEADSVRRSSLGNDIDKSGHSKLAIRTSESGKADVEEKEHQECKFPTRSQGGDSSRQQDAASLEMVNLETTFSKRSRNENEGKPSPRENRDAVVDRHFDADHHQTDGGEELKSTEGQASQEDDLNSDATDEEERGIEVENGEAEDAVVGGEFGDTTEEENDVVTSSQANILADADRRADVLLARSGYNSQLEDGYEPEDTHGYTEEEVSEAIHTEDEEEERRAVQKDQKTEINQTQSNEPEPIQHSMPHSSDDMDAADEHTEHEEDLGAESSELEETAEARDYTYSPSSEHERDPTTLLEFAQSAQRLHSKTTAASQPNQDKQETDQGTPGDKSVRLAESALPDSGDEVKGSTATNGSNQVESQLANGGDESFEETADNSATVEDEKGADSTMVTERLEMTEDTVDHDDSDEPSLEDRIGSQQIGSRSELEKDMHETAEVESSVLGAVERRGASEQQSSAIMSTDTLAEPYAMQTEEVGTAISYFNVMEMESPTQDMDIVNASENEMEVDEAGKGEGEPMNDEDAAPKDEVMEPVVDPMGNESETQPKEDALTIVDQDISMREWPSQEDNLESGNVLDPASSPAADAAMDTQPVSISGGLSRSSARHEPGKYVDATAGHDDVKAEKETPLEESVQASGRTREEEGHDAAVAAYDNPSALPQGKGTREEETTPTRDKEGNDRKDTTSDVSDDDSLPISQMVKGSASKEGERDDDEGSQSLKKSRLDKEGQGIDKNCDKEEENDEDSVAISSMVKSRRGPSGKDADTSEDENASKPAAGSARRGKRQKTAAGSPVQNTDDEKPAAVETRRSTRRTTRARASRDDETDGGEDDESIASSSPRRRSSRAKAGSEAALGTARSTRATRSKKTEEEDNDDDESIVSIATRTRSRAKKGTDDEESVASTSSRRSSRARRATMKASEEEKEEHKKPATRSRKGLPPRAPTTRYNTRQRKK